MEPRGLIARRVTEVAQSTLDMVTTAVDYPLCECIDTHCSKQFSLSTELIGTLRQHISVNELVDIVET